MIDSLPIDLKTKLVEKILSSIYPIQEEIDELWSLEVEKRLREIRYGEVETISADDVFREVQKRYM